MSIDPSLIARAQQLLNQARMISEVGAAQTSEIGHGHPSSSMPAGAFTFTASTLQACWVRINAAHSDVELEAANRWCETALLAITHGPPGRFAETVEQFRFRILQTCEGLTCPEIVRREHGTTSVTTVRNLRIADGRDPKAGHKLAVKGEGSGG
jgi:hypothetical protein